MALPRLIGKSISTRSFISLRSQPIARSFSTTTAMSRPRDLNGNPLHSSNLHSTITPGCNHKSRRDQQYWRRSDQQQATDATHWQSESEQGRWQSWRNWLFSRQFSIADLAVIGGTYKFCEYMEGKISGHTSSQKANEQHEGGADVQGEGERKVVRR